MGLYRYSASKEGRISSGEAVADSLPQAARLLQKRGLQLNELTEQRVHVARRQRLRLPEQVWLYRHLADLLQAEVPLPTALEVLARDAPSPDNAARLRAISRLVASQGLTIAEAMEQHPGVFGDYGTSVLRTAEATNRLAETLRMLSEYLHNAGRVAERRWLPVVYPAILLVLLGVIATFLMTFIVPKFVALFYELGLAHDHLPLATRAVMSASHTMSLLILPTAILALLVILVCLFSRRSPRVRLDLAAWSFWLPIFGRLNRDAASARVMGLLSVALQSGMPLDRALCASADAAGNELMRLAMRRAADRARRGYSAAESLAGARLLPPALIWQVQSAEQAGKLSSACQSLADTYMRRVRIHSTYAAATLEPLLMVLVGLCVATVGYGIFAPLVTIIGELSS
jgi:type II secretory pathway component PulF